LPAIRAVFQRAGRIFRAGGAPPRYLPSHIGGASGGNDSPEAVTPPFLSRIRALIVHVPRAVAVEA
jgi:hypothetical protein